MFEDAGPSAAANEPAAAPAVDAADWDEDDELLAMQQEAWVCHCLCQKDPSILHGGLP